MKTDQIDEEKLTKILVKWMKREIQEYDPYPIRWKHYSFFFLNSDDSLPPKK